MDELSLPSNTSSTGDWSYAPVSSPQAGAQQAWDETTPFEARDTSSRGRPHIEDGPDLWEEHMTIDHAADHEPYREEQS